MKSTAPSADGTVAEGVRKVRRRRPSDKPHWPRWLTTPSQYQQVARARSLLILSVLAGQKTVSDAIGEAKITRALYYQLEMKALHGMMAALDPLSSAPVNEHQELTVARARLRAMGLQVKQLTQRKRSAERLLQLVLKSNRAAVVRLPRGRRPKALSTMRTPGGDSP